MIISDCRHIFPEDPTLVLYHAECADGFGAAWAIWKRFPEVRFLPVKHGEPRPKDLRGERVVIVDFSYARPVLEGIAKEATS
ncbi:MAG: phosphoesterase, partial [Nitrospiraceae bacterium]